MLKNILKVFFFSFILQLKNDKTYISFIHFGTPRNVQILHVDIDTVIPKDSRRSETKKLSTSIFIQPTFRRL